MGDPRGGMMGGFHIGPPGMWWKNPGMVQRLTLTPEQTKKMDDIFQASRLELIDKKANVEKASAMLEPLLSANPVDTAKAMAQIDKVAQSRADLEKADAKMLLGIRGVLTPDQWTKLHTPPAPPAGGPQGATGGAPRGPGDAAGGPGGNPRGGYGGGGYSSGRGARSAAAPAGVEMDDTRP
jgi:Spy/CpxP family protein refolding chaperone